MSTLMARYPGINPMNSEEATGVYVENDPASLASQAAVELDNLLRSRGTSVPAVLILSRLINDEFSGGASKATTVGVMKRAISHAKLAPEPLNRVEQVESEASQVADHLKEIYEKVQGKRTARLQKDRTNENVLRCILKSKDLRLNPFVIETRKTLTGDKGAFSRKAAKAGPRAIT